MMLQWHKLLTKDLSSLNFQTKKYLEVSMYNCILEKIGERKGKRGKGERGGEG
jgi:hypothetical protein